MIFSSIPDLSLLRFENEINENGSKDSVSPNDVPAAKDDLLELAKKIQTEYADLFADIKQNDPLLAALKTKSDDYSSLYGNTGKLQGPFNTIKALFVTSALYDYDADLSLTSNGLKNLIASNGNLNSNVGDDADKLSIVPVANSAKVYYKYGPLNKYLF